MRKLLYDDDGLWVLLLHDTNKIGLMLLPIMDMDSGV
jgi:hypothetical protein